MRINLNIGNELPWNKAQMPLLPLFRKIIVENTTKDDFCVLAKPEAAKTEAFSYKLRVAMQLFDILSENSEIDHPLCEECTNGLFLQLDSQLRTLKQVTL